MGSLRGRRTEWKRVERVILCYLRVILYYLRDSDLSLILSVSATPLGSECRTLGSPDPLLHTLIEG